MDINERGKEQAISFKEISTKNNQWLEIATCRKEDKSFFGPGLFLLVCLSNYLLQKQFKPTDSVRYYMNTPFFHFKTEEEQCACVCALFFFLALTCVQFNGKQQLGTSTLEP